MLGCKKLVEILKIGKTTAANIIKEEKNICSQHELFHEKLKNEIVLGSTKILLRSYTSGNRDAVLLTFIQMDQC